MSEKSAQKRNLILENAKNVFVERGFKNVTMKDIIDASGISRGGLYLYFSSTKEIFLEVLKREAAQDDDVFSENFTEETTAADILYLFLQEQKKELFRKKDNLTVAIYEYYFGENMQGKGKELKKQFDKATKIVAKLIEAGVEEEVFYCEDCLGAALNIMYTFEGMKVASKTMGIKEATVDKEIDYILSQLEITKEFI
ncbi:MAG: TetR/AcrR family transcriptional regulator [Lachnospiraceae bacterium]|nr:TetR/AcrR family transcriptional regulator [Lachnospiraceae bacterium]